MTLIVSHGRMIQAREMLIGGALSGLFAGTLMLLVLTLRSEMSEMGLWYYPQLIASLVIGIESLVAGFFSAGLGLAIHFAISAFWGIVYGILWGRIQKLSTSMLMGVTFGFLVWAVTTFFLLPWAGAEIMAARVGLDQGGWLGAHLAFGLSFSVLPYVEELLAPPAELNPLRLKRTAWHRFYQRSQRP